MTGVQTCALPICKLHKLQIAFDKTPEKNIFDGLNVLKITRSGSLLQAIIRGEEEEILDYAKKLSPLFYEIVEPSLEEMFLYELEVIGYDVKDVIC